MMKKLKISILYRIFADDFVSFFSCGPKKKTSRTKNGPQTRLWETLV